ncbi:1-phosphofructokinase [Leucobacter alluvii]|uniref:1-phosphofructokinase n=2 Tax=Leucobacter alluvii TaxID=340321 RepID=A0ABP5MWB3_9MICO
MFGFLGGPIATPLIREFEELGIEDKHTKISEDTRVTTVVVELSSGRSTVLNEPGPLVSKSELSRFEDTLFHNIRAGDLIVCTGSLPRGVGDDCYGRISRMATERGAFTAIDASGEPLSMALKSAPWCVKCNRQEFTQALAITEDVDDAKLIELMREQTKRGSSIVIVTMGGSDFLAATQHGVWRIHVPQIDVVNATGSGDTFFGSFIAAIWRGDDLEGALRDATAGGVVNALQLEAGLQVGASLEPYRSQVWFGTAMLEGLRR